MMRLKGPQEPQGHQERNTVDTWQSEEAGRSLPFSLLHILWRQMEMYFSGCEYRQCVCVVCMCVCVLTVFWTTTCIRPAAAAYITTTGVRATLAPARSQPTTGRAHYQGRQLPQIPTLRKIKKTHQETWFPWQKHPEGSAVLKSFLLTGYEVSDQQQGRAWMMHNLLSGLSKGLMMNFLWVWC